MSRITAVQLRFGYADRLVGEDVNFTVDPGEVMAVLGPNGSGKTTLFRTLLRLLPVLSGIVMIEDRPLADWGAAELARTIAYVPQAHTSHFAFRVRDMVLMGRSAQRGIFATPGIRDHDIAATALATLGIANLADRSFTHISGGERQLVLIARALATEANTLVMDEPTANLDFGNRMLIIEQILHLRSRGHTVLFCTHDPDHAFMCANRALLLHRGRVLALGSPHDVVTSENLKRLYSVDVEVVDAPGAARPQRMCRPNLARDVSQPGP